MTTYDPRAAARRLLDSIEGDTSGCERWPDNHVTDTSHGLTADVRQVVDAVLGMGSYEAKLEAARHVLWAFLATTDDTPRSSPEPMQGVVERHAHALAALGSPEIAVERSEDAPGPSTPAVLTEDAHEGAGHQDATLLADEMLRLKLLDIGLGPQQAVGNSSRAYVEPAELALRALVAMPEPALCIHPGIAYCDRCWRHRDD